MDPADHPDDAAALARDEGDGRAMHRESLFLGVEIRRTGVTTGRIRNISATGALIEAGTQFVIGEHVVLSFRGVAEVGATVVRMTPKGAGVRFDEKIDPAVCRQSVVHTNSKVATWAPPPQPVRYSHPGLQARPRR